MDYEEVEEDGVAIYRIKGRLDANTAPVFEKKVLDSINDNSPKACVFNFSEVNYLSSAGMRLLLSVMKGMKAKGGSFHVCSLSDGVMEVVKMAGFNQVLSVHDDEGQALAAV